MARAQPVILASLFLVGRRPPPISPSLLSSTSPHDHPPILPSTTPTHGCRVKTFACPAPVVAIPPWHTILTTCKHKPAPTVQRPCKCHLAIEATALRLPSPTRRSHRPTRVYSATPRRNRAVVPPTPPLESSPQLLSVSRLSDFNQCDGQESN